MTNTPGASTPPTDAFGSWMGNFADSYLRPAVDYGNAWLKVNDVSKEALDRFGLTPFLEGALGIDPLTVSDFFGKDYNYFTDTVMGTAGKAFLEGDQSVLDSILDGSFDYSGFLASLADAGKRGAGSGQPVNNNNAAGIGSAPVSPTVNDYLNAELAKFYGMDRNTAYQEALANTAYQRSVRDMQAAGLNPAAIFGNGRGSTAGGVGYVGSAGSASGIGSASKTQLFDSDTYGMFSSLAGLAAVAVTKNPGNFWLGQQSAQAVMKTLNVLDSKYGK